MKFILQTIVVLILLLIVLVIGALFYIDGIAKTAIESGGTRAFDVRTSVSDVDIGILSRNVRITRLTVANPEGYGGGNFLDLGNGHAAVSIGALMDEPAVVTALDLADINLYLEKKLGKKGNYEVILDNLKRFESDGPAEPKQEGKRFVIQQVVIRNVNVIANILPVGGKAVSLKFQVPELRFAYDTEEGLPIGQITGTILKAIFKSIVEKAGGILPDDLLGGLGAQLAALKYISSLGIEVIGDLAGLEQIGKNIGQIGKVGEQLEEHVGKAIEEGLGGLLKKKEKSASPSLEP